MGRQLHALMVEDNERDTELLLRELKRGGFDVTYERVETPEGLIDALARKHWDIVLSDFSMPRFTGPAALALVRARKIDLPFIIVSGTVNEDLAVEALHAGAQDFMAKGKLARLIPAIERELKDVALRVERTKMAEQLLISDRMASVGTLAAGVAHEINNPLAALMANLEFVAEDLGKLSKDIRLPADSRDEESPEWLAPRLREIEEPLQEAHDAAVRVRNIVRDLKIFSRADDEVAGAVDLRRVLESTVRIAWNEIRHRAKLTTDYADVPPVQGNEGRLGQVFLNLIVNAAQAIPEGSADTNEIHVATATDALGRVVVEIRDTGSGIPESILGKIFDPFVTTKPTGVGTGLGLAICHRIVTGMGGQIAVETALGKGTTFRTILPAAVVQAPEPPVVEPVAARGASGRILVIDDEPIIGVAIRRMLKAQHDVHAVTTAREALTRITAGERFDLILCDLMMPAMTGMDVYDELVSIAPDQAERMIFMTGGAFTPRSREFLERVDRPRLDKPFDSQTVSALVNRVLRRD